MSESSLLTMEATCTQSGASHLRTAERGPVAGLLMKLNGAKPSDSSSPELDPRDLETRVFETGLIVRAQRGESHAFSQLMDLYRERMVRLAYNMTGNMEEANDLAQEAFVRVYRALNTFDAQRPFKPWIYRIAQNVILDHFRQKKVRPAVAEPNPDRPYEERHDVNAVDPQKTVISKEVQQRVHSAIQSLPENYREVVIYRYIDNLSYAEIAEALGLTETNVMMRMSRARQMLRERLKYLQTQ